MVTRMDVDGYAHVVEGGEYMYYEDHQREVAQLQARVAELEAALQRALRFIREAPVGSGVCCCGDGVEGHASAWDCGHTPVDMWDDASSSLFKELSPVARLVYP